MRGTSPQPTDSETPRWPFPVFGSTTLLGGFALVAVGLPLEHFFVHPTLRFFAELLVEIGKALIITGAIAWILEIAHVVAYFEDRLFRVFMHPRFLEKLDRKVTLPGVHRAITTFLFGGTDDPEAKDYYDYLTRHHAKLAGESFRRNMTVSVDIESLNEAPNTKTTVTTTYTVVPVPAPGEGPQTYKYRVPSPITFDAVPGLKPEDQILEWSSEVILPEGGGPPNTAFSAVSKTEGGASLVEVTKDFEFEIKEELTYREKVVVTQRHMHPWAFSLRITGRTKEVTLSVRWPGATDFRVFPFGDLSKRKIEDHTAAGVTFHYDDWMVPGHGILITFMPPRDYRCYPADSDAAGGGKTETAERDTPSGLRG